MDFEVGLNSAVRKLREALDDSPENPRFIETVPRRGYRFVGSVVAPAEDPEPPLERAADPDHAVLSAVEQPSLSSFASVPAPPTHLEFGAERSCPAPLFGAWCRQLCWRSRCSRRRWHRDGLEQPSPTIAR